MATFRQGLGQGAAPFRWRVTDPDASERSAETNAPNALAKSPPMDMWTSADHAASPTLNRAEQSIRSGQISGDKTVNSLSTPGRVSA